MILQGSKAHRPSAQGHADLCLSLSSNWRKSLFHSKKNPSLCMFLPHILSTDTLSRGHLGIERQWLRLWWTETHMPICGRVAPAHHTFMPPLPWNRVFVRLHISQLPLHQGRSCDWNPPMEWNRGCHFQTKVVENSVLLHCLFPIPQAEIKESKALVDGGDTERKEPQSLNYLPWARCTWVRNQLLLGYATEIWRAMLS